MKYINYLELLGAFNCLKIFTEKREKINVLLRVDHGGELSKPYVGRKI